MTTEGLLNARINMHCRAGGVNSMIPTGAEPKAFVRETDFLLQ